MATQNDYGLVWMNSNSMMMPDTTPVPHVPPDMMAMDQAHQIDNNYYPLAMQSTYDGVNHTPMDLDGFILMDDIEGDYCGEPPRFMTAATQTIASARRKIRPVKHPGLKLQTPIAYKCDTDPNVIPIEKDGMAVCQKCGAMGVKHAFYTRYRKYCSLACARGSLGANDGKDITDDNDYENSQSQDGSINYSHFVYPNGSEVKVDDELVTTDILPLTLPNIDTLPSFNLGPGMGSFTFPGLVLPDEPTVSNPGKSDVESYDWDSRLWDPAFSAVPVSSFRHAPMSDCWNDNIVLGMKVEVENTDCEDLYDFSDSFWVATVLRVAGYKALLRYEGFTDVHRDFWVNICSPTVHPVGWCAMRGKPLIPPKRFWCHEDSPLLHPVGWAMRVKHRIKATAEYLERCENGVMDKDDAAEELFTAPFQSNPANSTTPGFTEGMRLEAIDPLNLSAICATTVMQVLEDGYMMIRIDKYADDNSNIDEVNWFCYHASSPLIFPAGFCEDNGIEVDPPKTFDGEAFSWQEEAKKTGSHLAPASLFRRDIPDHGFKSGMQLESTDLMEPSLICTAAVVRVIGRLLRVHFDGWDDGYDQWMDCSSPDIFPVGWCNLVTYKLEGPGNPERNIQPAEKKKPVKRKKCKGRGRIPRIREPDTLDISETGSQGEPEINALTVAEESPNTLPDVCPKDVDSVEQETPAPQIPVLEDCTPETSTLPSVNSTFIPRLADFKLEGDLSPETWTCDNVAAFLKLNDCAGQADSFVTAGKDGSALLRLTQDDLMGLTNFKIGPALKILELIKQLKVKAAMASKKKSL